MAKEKKKFVATKDPVGQIFTGITLVLAVIGGIGMIVAFVTMICGVEDGAMGFGIFAGIFIFLLFMHWTVSSVSKIVINTIEMNETLKEIRNSLKSPEDGNSETQQ